jgi:hypothetical protein
MSAMKSEAMPGNGTEHEGPRRYSVRSFDKRGDIKTVGKFHSYETLNEARAAIRELQTQTREEVA